MPGSVVQMVARSVAKPEQAREVLRLAALLAQVSGGVSDAERGVLSKLSGEMKLPDDAVDGALREVEKALAD